MKKNKLYIALLAVVSLMTVSCESKLDIDKHGNMSAACIPVSLTEAQEAGRLHKGDNVILVAFGAGLTWAGALVKWAK